MLFNGKKCDQDLIKKIFEEILYHTLLFLRKSFISLRIMRSYIYFYKFSS